MKLRGRFFPSKLALAAFTTIPIIALCVQTQAQKSAGATCLTDCSTSQISASETAAAEYPADIQQLMQTLSGAYGNSLKHDVPNADLGAQDQDLETASIQLSFRILDGIGENGCRSADPNNVHPDQSSCSSGGKLSGLPELASSLSYAAYALEKLQAASATMADNAGSDLSQTLARMGAMEHLYRMVFTVANIYLDPSQGGSYLEPAQEQLRLARTYMESEEALCGCNPPVYALLFPQLSELSDRIKTMRESALP